MLVQKLKVDNLSPMKRAERYYACISSLNNLGLRNKEVELLAYMALNSGKDDIVLKEGFCEMFSTTVPTVTNMFSRLRRKKILIKRNNKTMIFPQILLDFSREIKLEVVLGKSEG